MSTFFEKSVQIADDFIQTIVLIDDQAYVQDSDDPQHDLDANALTTAFASKQKFCAVYKPNHVRDLPNLTAIAKKADIVILDWRMKLAEDTDPSDEETVVDVDDPRGPHTLSIVGSVASSSTVDGTLKLIFIYTGEIDLAGVANQVHQHLSTINTETQKNTFEVYADHFKVVVIGKPTLLGQHKHMAELQDQIVKYEELPDFVVRSFSKMTSGLISDFVLQSLCVLRNNTSRLLGLYHPSLDPALVSHCALLPTAEDAEEQLIDMLTQSMSALLKYHHRSDESFIKRMDDWLEYSMKDSYLAQLQIEKIPSDPVAPKVDKLFLKDWVQKCFQDAYKEARIRLNPGAAALVSEDIRAINDNERTIHKKATRYFTSNSNYKKLDQKFSVLTHHKSNLKQVAQAPFLSLGTIMKSEIGGDYFVCIQQRCDSVRIKQPFRQFLFLPLLKVNEGEGFNFTALEGASCSFLKVDSKTFNLKTIQFSPTGTTGLVRAEKPQAENQYLFISMSEGNFIWLSDLKDAHAQRLANEFSARLARVGLDESEWLRRWSSLKGEE